MAVYGDMLSAFTEQFRMFPYFSMKPRTVAGYEQREDLGKIRGVFQYLKKGALDREEETLNETNVPTFWTRQKLKVGNFITADDIDFRITNDYPWMFEGGYYCYGLESIVSNTDKQTPMPDVDMGQNSFL